MYRIVSIAAALLAIPASAAAPAAQFNLNCAGTLNSSSILGDKSEEYTATYRIDLAKKKWCEQDCKALHDIVSIQPAQLTLSEERVDSPSERSFLINMIDRETGAHKIISSSENYRIRGSILNLRWEGTCEPATFTGFPDLKTKF
ncbi:MAG: hypothetical protein KAF42_08385 [Sphingopyxis terrae]|nr:hypothetical protein [Sphingopyxis terrae]